MFLWFSDHLKINFHLLAGLEFEKPNETHWPKESALAIRYNDITSLKLRNLWEEELCGSPTSQIFENVKLDFS